MNRRSRYKCRPDTLVDSVLVPEIDDVVGHGHQELVVYLAHKHVVQQHLLEHLNNPVTIHRHSPRLRG